MIIDVYLLAIMPYWRQIMFNSTKAVALSVLIFMTFCLLDLNIIFNEEYLKNSTFKKCDEHNKIVFADWFRVLKHIFLYIIILYFFQIIDYNLLILDSSIFNYSCFQFFISLFNTQGKSNFKKDDRRNAKQFVKYKIIDKNYNNSNIFIYYFNSTSRYFWWIFFRRNEKFFYRLFNTRNIQHPSFFLS